VTVLPVTSDWNDVLRRARRSRTRVVVRRGALVACLALVVASPALGLGGWLDALRPGHAVPVTRLAPSDVSRLSALATGSAVPLARLQTAAERREALRRFGLVDVRRVARLAGETFFVVDLRGGTRCYGAGVAAAPELFGVLNCPGAGGFPSKGEPILDLSSRVGGGTTLAGLAADGIRSIRATVDGRVTTVPVVGNVFALPDPAVVGNAPLVALDARGRPVGTTRSAAGLACSVRVYLDVAATPTEVSEAIAAARSTPHVARVTFVSRRQALLAMRRKYPSLTKGITSNPFPDSITVLPDEAAHVLPIALLLRHDRLSGVIKVEAGRC
jgi:hypothetical protein